MIICPNHNFVFIHIPKCAGTSMRIQIMKCDPDYIALGRPKVHPELGKIDYGHIPLSTLQEFFPDHYAYLDKFDSFAIVRDPLERFGSALRQVMWQYEKRPMTLIPASEMRDRTLRMLDEIHSEIDNPSYRFIFFARQSSFIYLESRKVVKKLVPVSLVPNLINYLGRRTNTKLEAEARANQNVELRFKGIGKSAYGINTFLRERLPTGIHSRIKTSVLKVIASKRSAAEANGILDMPEVQDFVATHYKWDDEIYESVMDDKLALKTALNGDKLQFNDMQ